MAEVFHEVDAQIRVARLQMLVKRGWPFALLVAGIAAVLAVAAWALNRHEQSQAAAASETYDAGMQALAHGDLKAADSRFADLSRGGPRGYRTLALMEQAGIRMNTNKSGEAVSLLDQAAQSAPNAILGDAARLEAAYAVIDTGPYAATRARLVPLTAPGRPFRMLAAEALGMTELASGRVAEARGDLQVVALSSDVSDAARTRANAALSLIRSGAWSSLKPLSRQAAKLSPQAPPPQPSPGAVGGQDQTAPQSGAAQ